MIRGPHYLTAALLACVAINSAPAALAQDYPTRFVTIVAPFQAGGPSDTVARLIAAPMSKALGQQVVVENVSGAGGTIGSGRVAKAAPDGYTLGISGSGTHAAVEQLYANPPYRALDFESVGLINTTPVVIVGKRDLPPNTLRRTRRLTCVRTRRPSRKPMPVWARFPTWLARCSIRSSASSRPW